LFLFLILFLSIVTITVITSSFISRLMPADLIIKSGILHIIITTLYSVTHLNVITIVNRWWLLSSRPQIMTAWTGGRPGVTTASFLSFLSSAPLGIAVVPGSQDVKQKCIRHQEQDWLE
jgi:hypothetical protein